MILPDEIQERVERSAFSAYFDAAQGTEHIHDRLSNGASSAARAVVVVLESEGFLRAPLVQVAVHGTFSGYSTGCRCEFCREAASVYWKAHRHYGGENKVRSA